MARPLTALDRWTFNEGTHIRLYEVMGSHPHGDATYFRGGAPNASRVSVVGDFNAWDEGVDEMVPDRSGIWEKRVEGATRGQHYKYALRTRDGRVLLKQDPQAFFHERAPRTASVVWDLHYEWGD